MATRQGRTVSGTDARQRPWPIRLLWFAGLWVASVSALGAVAYGIRFWLGLN